MNLFDFFKQRKPQNSASLAKERLQIIVAHERRPASSPDFLPSLQQDILEVVRKYVPIQEEQIRLSLDRSGDCEVLELNISLAEAERGR